MCPHHQGSSHTAPAAVLKYKLNCLILLHAMYVSSSYYYILYVSSSYYMRVSSTSSYYYMRVLILLYACHACPRTTICVSACYYMRVLMLLYACRPHTTRVMRVLVLLYACPHATIYTCRPCTTCMSHKAAALGYRTCLSLTAPVAIRTLGSRELKHATALTKPQLEN